MSLVPSLLETCTNIYLLLIEYSKVADPRGLQDIIEPLESVSVSITPADKDDITEFGDPKDVRQLFTCYHHTC